MCSKKTHIISVLVGSLLQIWSSGLQDDMSNGPLSRQSRTDKLQILPMELVLVQSKSTWTEGSKRGEDVVIAALTE